MHRVPMMSKGRTAVLVFDAYPLAAVLLGELAGETSGRVLADAIALGDASVSVTNLAEVVDLVARLAAADPADVLDTVELWVDAGLNVRPLSWETAGRAASLRAVHYHRTRCAVSLSDCVAVALAHELGATLVTSDQPMVAVAVAAGVRVNPIADSRGVTPVIP